MAIWKVKRRHDAAETEPAAVGAETASPENEDWQAKYTAEREAFEKYRSEVAAAEEKRMKTDAYRSLLGECGIPERHRDKLTRLYDTDSIVIGEDGMISGREAIKESIRADWGELVPKSSVPVAKPAISRGHTLTKESIMAIRNRDARRSAMMNNPELFGL